MAAGDILSVVIPATGDRAEITIEGKGTGGTYDLGIGSVTDPVIDNAKIVFEIVSLGYLDNFTLGTNTRLTFGSKFVRKVTPNEAQADETVSGSDVIVRVWLHELVYAKDKSGGGNSGTDPIVDIAAGFYTQGGTGNNAFSGAVTNNSTVAYQKPVANWVDGPKRRLTTADHKCRVFACERHGQQRRPCRGVKFTRTDQHSHTSTADVLNPIIDATRADQEKVIEYVGEPALSAHDQNDEITDNFKVYPWVGDVILDSSDAVNAALSPRYCPQNHICDKDGTYGVTVALVDPIGGNDTTGQAYDEAVYNPGTAAKCLTISGAAAKIAAYNNTNRSGRNDVGAGRVELEEGNYNWSGATHSYGTVPKCVMIVRPKTGALRANTVINAGSGASNPGHIIKIENVKITTTTANSFTDIVLLWFHTCHFDTTGTTLWNSSGGKGMIFTECQITRLGIGLTGFSTANHVCLLIRGNLFEATFTQKVVFSTMVGNRKTGFTAGNTITLMDDFTGFLGPAPAGTILACNAFYGLDNLGVSISMGDLRANTHGAAIVQNLFENAGNSGGNGMASIGASDSTVNNTPIENFIIWNNTFVGQRCFIGYNEVGSTTKWRRYWSSKGNYWDRWANKGDIHPTANANRIGAWQITNAVGSLGDYLCQNMHSLPGSFFREFNGFDCHEPATSGTLTEAKFIDRKSASEGVAGTGGGNYRTEADSPLRNFATELVLPYDLDGNARTAGFNDAGAFTSPDPSGGGNGGGGGGRGGKGGIRNGLSLRI